MSKSRVKPESEVGARGQSQAWLLMVGNEAYGQEPEERQESGTEQAYGGNQE